MELKPPEPLKPDYPVTQGEASSAKASPESVGESQVSTGFDLVYIPDFAAQLEVPGTRFGQVFTDREWRHLRGSADSAASAAGLWAAKEALVKAWSARLFGQPSVISEEEFDWREVQVIHDAWGRPALSFSGRVHEALTGHGLRSASVSISHDADYAAAWVQVVWG